jgi:serine/threonine protein kinase
VFFFKGITLYQLTTGQLPFSGRTIHQIYESIRTAPNDVKLPDFIVDKNLFTLLQGLMQRKPTDRWSIKQIRDSDWFKKKHPWVKEELACLPSEVVQNELYSPRMIQYLRKLEGEQIITNNDQQIVNDNQHQPNDHYFTQSDSIMNKTSFSNHYAPGAPLSVQSSQVTYDPSVKSKNKLKNACLVM